MMYRVLLVASLCATLCSEVLATQSTGDEASVLAAVQRFFDTMASKDVAGAREILDPEGSFVSIRWQDGQRVVRRSSNRDYLEGLEEGSEAWLERMWEPRVLIHGPIAIVWTEYDFHRDDKFSHCGVDAFQLTKLDTGWTITGGTYTVETTDCAERPLGPPGEN